MFDLIIRTLRHPIDYLGFFRRTTLTLTEIVEENDGTYSFIFTAPTLPPWRAGQHAIFSLADYSINSKNWRPFSVASASHEGVIRIGTVIPPTPSAFKQKLLELRPGNQVKMYGPFGELYVKPRVKNIVAVASGIGITPFRSILSDLAKTSSEVKFTLIYAARAEHTYQASLNEWQADNPNITIIYTSEPEETQQKLIEQIEQQGNDVYYFISGAPAFIESMRRELRSRRIRPGQIINDTFKGY